MRHAVVSQASDAAAEGGTLHQPTTVLDFGRIFGNVTPF
jgi:hypothetical protein